MTGASKEPQLLPGQSDRIAHHANTEVFSGVKRKITASGQLHIFSTDHDHAFRRREKHRFIERFQPLLKHLYLAVDIPLQRQGLFCGHFQLLQLLIEPVDFLQRGIHVQSITLRFRLGIRSDKESLSCSQSSPLIGAQLCALSRQASCVS